MEKKLKKLLKQVKLSESTISTIFGALVVVVVGILIFNYFKQSNSAQMISDQAAQEENMGLEFDEEDGQMIPKNLPATHTVSSNETLWIIAQNYYGSGYNWVDIAGENNLVNPDSIAEGQELVIPKIAVKNPEGIDTQAVVLADTNAQEGTYVVKKGESLWDISVAVYSDGYKWSEIAQANSLVNPDYIEEGQVLNLP